MSEMTLRCTDQRYKIRQEEIKPVYVQLLNWIKEESTIILPKSPIGKAIYYYQQQYPKLINVLDQGDLKLDNKRVENKIRP